ncbi:DUF4259 domain-containing protein [Corynebacterium freiburgense]|uniref:DUF4259 domain-containing protein n=1 Tax=Corynebacterium freiburgense TaxID=556548 RepID=UPI00040C88CE|nr:DUF4259 domain-containing protein [Corynebacterium freiburgense]WJZ03002.1 hypothetical protein CFREI_08620 [Corynebacterium freiburgense]
MGAWGYRYFENDDAADWFHTFWESKDWEFLKKTVLNFSDEEGMYDEIRAAAHVLISFHSAYTAPSSTLDDLDLLQEKTLGILRGMIDSENEQSFFLEEWDYAEDVIADVQHQISQLEAIVNR